MKYPCEECLVDVIYTEVCDDLIFYSDNLTPRIPKFLVSTENRAKRLRTCILNYGGDFDRKIKLGSALVASRNKMRKERKKNEKSM